VQVSRWGNSLAVRLPAALVQRLGLTEGDEVDLVPVDRRTLEVRAMQTRAEAVAALRALARPLPPGYKFDHEELYQRGRDEDSAE
jgi:antitoxin MazE